MFEQTADLEVFARTLDCVGVDIDREMLRIAALRCPDVEFVHAGMATFDLGRRFDVVTCLFSSIAYSPTVAALRRTVKTPRRSSGIRRRRGHRAVVRSRRLAHERHELRLFDWQQYLDAFEAAGLDVCVDDYGLFGRGLIIGTSRE